MSKCKDCKYAEGSGYKISNIECCTCSLTRRVMNANAESNCNCFNRDLSEYDICYNCKHYIGGGDWGLFCSHEDMYHHLGKFSDAPCKRYERKGEPMVEQGTDSYGAEYKRTSNDFTVRPLTQDNCLCNICHGTGAKWAIRYVTRNYQSARTKRICKTLQAHEHSFWICPACLENFTALTGLKVVRAERRTE